MQYADTVSFIYFIDVFRLCIEWKIHPV